MKETITIDLDGTEDYHAMSGPGRYARYWISRYRPRADSIGSTDEDLYNIEVSVKERRFILPDKTIRCESKKRLREDEVEDAMWELYETVVDDRSHLAYTLKQNVRKFHPEHPRFND